LTGLFWLIWTRAICNCSLARLIRGQPRYIGRIARGVNPANYDKVLGYDYLLDRFFPLSVTGEYLLGISQTGLTLENLDSISVRLTR
jgi:hypothetical protein